MRRHLFQGLCCVLILLPFKGRAQFYAPETEFHDKAQRLFVVEAARVLAWRENLHGRNISEVAYQVTVDTNRVTQWNVQWLDPSGKVLQEFRVSYPEASLKDGPQFYRHVLRQMQARGKWAAPFALTAVKLDEEFWKGANRNGMAREEGLKEAFKLVATNSLLSEAEQSAQLAGLLSMLPMPSLCGGLTLDAVLLARGAAWLAMTESALESTNHIADENWAAILFMAGRENAACALWQEKVNAQAASQDKGPLYSWWNVFLRRPTARAGFEFVANSEQHRFAMPLMCYYSRLEGLQTPTVRVVALLYGRDAETLTRLHNYGSFLAASTDIAGGRLLEGALPALSRSKWIETLKSFSPSSLDYSGYGKPLVGIKIADPLEQPDTDDPSLTGLDECAPLLALGYEQGVGKLIPVATVTARDLLNYGWEMNGLQMGARYQFVNQAWGIPTLADTILRRATRSIEGQAPFFPNGTQGKAFKLQETLYRLQMVDDLSWRVDVNIQPFAKDTSVPETARLFYRRCWLRPYEVRWQAWSLTRANLCDERLWLMRQYHAESGKLSDEIMLEYFRDKFIEKDFDDDPELQRLREQIAEVMIDPSAVQMGALWRKKYARLSGFERAEACERLFWLSPDCGFEQDVLNHYITSGAWISAKRFYKQIRAILGRDVAFSSYIAPQAWMMGFLTGDEELMALAVEDSDTGSLHAMMTHVWHSTAHGKMREAEEQLSEIIERYESQSTPRSTARIMKGFFPLIPALADPKSPQHEKALDYFGKSEVGTSFRWILIRRYKLSASDAVRFLGGQETDRLRRLLVMRLQAPHEPRNEAFVDFLESAGNKGAGRALASWAAGQTEKFPSTFVQKDLKPAEVRTIQEAVLERLNRK